MVVLLFFLRNHPRKTGGKRNIINQLRRIYRKDVRRDIFHPNIKGRKFTSSPSKRVSYFVALPARMTDGCTPFLSVLYFYLTRDKIQVITCYPFA